MDEKFDCIIVGGGIAGLSAAMILARANVRFLLIERGEFCGAKNVSGGVLWGRDLARLVPEYHEEDGFERFVNHRRLTFMDAQSAFTIDFKSSHFDAPPYSGVTVLRARFDAWLAEKVQAAIDASDVADESFLATNILVEEVLMEDGRAVGIRAGEEKFYADVVLLAEGVNNLLTRQVGLQADYVPADYVAVGVKEVIGFDRNVLEDRFQLRGRSGLTNEFVGYASGGVEGGGFLYTNTESVSLGLVLGMKDLREKGRKPYDLLNEFKAHPVVADMIRGGEVLEYSAHVVSVGDLRGMPREVYADGVLIAGEAAGLLLNAGRAIQGMDYAMRSGILAAETVIAARERGDFSAATLKNYRTALENSYVMKDLRTFQDAVHLLHSPMMFGPVPELICDFGRQFFTVDSAPTPRAGQMLRAAIKRHASYWDLIKLGIKAARAL
ncbi:MAG: FAD-dependent oxidoreductase [Rhodothermaceae bacterium]|uniref:FAD-dependent oxidoreductase n=1 Tax=Rhodocaloribacter litoris TaxID=2558931 RepID=UPI001E2DED47|nr:FAD-dependent oxidoreductase [Rhodocaloribacter litoris]GIV59022.1 MAG: FAD-dependent oxidoreductase [Rhodothermaceae bacterium]